MDNGKLLKMKKWPLGPERENDWYKSRNVFHNSPFSLFHFQFLYHDDYKGLLQDTIFPLRSTFLPSLFSGIMI